jgi:hypothetical protein
MHSVPALEVEAADRIGGLLFPPAADEEPPDEGTAGLAT